LLVLVTALWPDWIELLTGLHPDRHSGALEAGITAAFLVGSIVAGLLARVEWRRAGREAVTSP
jgi:hypothetical protein